MRRQHTTYPEIKKGIPIHEDYKNKTHERRYRRVLWVSAIKYKWQMISFHSLIFVLGVAIWLNITTWKRTLPSFHPRYIRFIVTVNGGRTHTKATRLDHNMELYPSKRLVQIARRDQARQKSVRENSDDYRYGRADEFETGECKAQYVWQRSSFPTCNLLHEISLLDVRDDALKITRLLGNGYWRDVWLIHDVVLKTLRLQHDFEERNYDRHRRDAVATEHLTKSKMVVNIYGFCANSAVFQYADGGSISDIIWPRKAKATLATDLERLHAATHAAMGIAAMHNIDKEGVASIAHTDISPAQFVAVGGIYRLNDFNRARFIRWNTTSNLPCSYSVGKNPGKNRSPEEYSLAPQSEKVDIYSFGNILYMLITGLWPFMKDLEEDAQEQVKLGIRPPFPEKLQNSTDPILNDLKDIMIMCHEQDPMQRPSAREVENLLLQSLQRHDPTALDRWGLEKDYGGKSTK